MSLDILTLAHNVFPSYEWGKHHHFVANELYKVVTGETDRLILAQPPQTSKSTLAAELLPAFYLMNYPNRNVILASYEANLAYTHAERAMKIVEEWGWITGVKLGKRQSMARWTTSEGGQMNSGSLGGGITGKPSDLFIIDDPLKNDEAANSPLIRDKLLREFQACCETRLSPKAAVVLMGTRWHPADLHGCVLKLAEQGGKQWKHISLPALATDAQDPLGRAIGESIWKERYPKEFYEARKAQYELTGATYQWESLYQQNPVSGNRATEWTASYFPESMWITEETRPNTPVKLRVLAIDPSKGSDSKAGDYQAIVLTELLEDNSLIVESWINRQTAEAMIDTILALWKSRQPNAIVIESGSGQGLYGALIIDKAKPLGGTIPLYSFEQYLAKIPRIRVGLSPILAQHKIKFLKTVSNQILVSQLKEFATSSHDDGPDALELSIQMLNKLISGSRKHVTPVLKV